MKLLNWFILKSYLRPLLRSFGVSLVILVLLFLSRYKNDLFGKGLELATILKIVGFAAIPQVVLALPVAVLLSSLFTLGNFGENYELAAMRAAGMSLARILRPMFYATVVITVLSFVLSSYVVPWANLKVYAILYDVQQLKPVFRLQPGHFNEGIDDYVIRITDKEVAKDLLYGVSIYDHTHGSADTMPVMFYNKGTPQEFAHVLDSTGRNNRFVTAASGTMRLDPYGRYMNMMLYDGASYEAKVDVDRRGRRRERYVRVFFDSLYYSFDMQGFGLERTDEKAFKSHQYMLNLNEIDHAIDSIQKVKLSIAGQLESALATEIVIDSNFIKVDTLTYAIPPEDILRYFPKGDRGYILQVAMDRAQGARKIAERAISILEEEDTKIRERQIEFHFKLSLPLACLIFMFIGAPLGAIIRKGGAGVPILVSFIMYITFTVLMIQGKKMAAEGVLTPFTGAWLPVIVMFPLALLLSLESLAAVPIFTGDNLWRFSRTALRLLIVTNPVFWLYQIPPVGRAMRWMAKPIGRLFGRKETQRTFRVRR